MLEGAVARILNQLLGKYVVDLDTENLNVGIFSGHVQLTDLKLKIEALYELNLPIKVIAGTIGKVWLQIPWGALWNQPVVVNIEDVHLIAGPIVNSEPYDAEKNKRLCRAFKKKALHDVSANTELIGGPNLFSEYLITNIVNNLQLNISNVHIRYDDFVSGPEPLVAGICIGSIIAETTNNKWKACKNMKSTDTCHYLVKIEALSIYWNPKHKPEEWDLPTQYYAWRNAMSTSLQNYCMNGEDFEFLIRPMTTKIKMTINKSKTGYITKLLNDIVIHDFNMQISKEQYESIKNVCNSLSRMFISWNFLAIRPKEKVLEHIRAWWKYAYDAALEQRVRPYTWSKIKKVRENYKQYSDIYKKILLNPNDTELKLDLQLYEDKLGVVNIVIARQQARLAVHSANLSEKSFWDILPSPERQLLCEKIGFNDDQEKSMIDFNYNFRIGNSSLTMFNNGKEILVITMTQFISFYQPNFIEDTYKVNLKIEGIIIEGASLKDHLVPIISSDHNGHNSPAFFLKLEVEKLPIKSNTNYRFNCVLEYLELAYHKHAYDEVQNFFGTKYFSANNILTLTNEYPGKICNIFRSKLLKKWDFYLDIKLPYIVLPEAGSLQSGENILILDGGQLKLNTEICEETDILEDATQMELEEQLYSRFHMEWNGCQVLFCDNSETWRESRKEKDTELHILPKTNFSAVYSTCIRSMKSMPKHKLNLTVPTIKLNISERKIVLFFKFLNSFDNEADVKKEILVENLWKHDKIMGKLESSYLLHVQNNIILFDKLIKNRRNKDKTGLLIIDNKKKSNEMLYKDNMNEVWARCVDLPGLEDNISPNNTISTILRFVVNEFQLVYSRSSTDRQYLMLRLCLITLDMAWMTYGPAYQLTLNSLILTDKLHTTPSGQYLDLIHSPIPTAVDVLTILYRKVAANCPDFWTHFHGVETSLVADFGTIHAMLHQEAFHTIIKYTRYLNEKIKACISPSIAEKFMYLLRVGRDIFTNKAIETPVPPGSVKFSHSARLGDLNIRICDSDFDIINVNLSGLEVDFLFRANERFVFRSFLSNINIEHLSDVTLYSKVLSTDEDKVFEVKYVRYASTQMSDISPTNLDKNTDGSFKFNLGQIHATFLYKLFVQMNRFIINLEAIPYLQMVYEFINKYITKATDTLKASTKIHLAINLKGPVLLIPQKSSSPNVVIIDTGDLTVENFFKEYHDETVENILVKLEKITISRGVMALTSILEMQETIIEPVNLHLDIKRYQPNTKSNAKSLNWDIAGVMDIIEITLGQRDLAIILSIYTDNIGEGKILDLFPVVKSPTAKVDVDETVKSLEAFFCEPKQKDISIKFSFDSIELSLFFDSGELLSSPIRDLNHGLCKYQVSDILTSCIIYTDRSLDGKLAVDTILIKEIGPDANAFDKGILQSPIEDNKNNNCNITINNPPIIDITFHQTKSSDKSIDIIIGRLCLTLSVPFCEKLAMFVLECIPKDNLEVGIVNHGYVSDQIQEFAEVKQIKSSLTIAVRVNKPEFLFVVETASSKKRYFITKTEILSDFSRHSNRQNLVISLSGLHTLFYDVGLNTIEPYTILKQCDVELSKSFTEEKGEKITISVSSINIQFCNRVIYSINDILNDISEHFKLPDADLSPKEVRIRSGSKTMGIEELWEPKKLNEFVQKGEDDFVDTKKVIHEIFLLPKIEIVIILELEDNPVIILKSTIELTMYDWSSLLNCTCDFTVQANYFNENVQLWEPIIDPIVMDENVYKPWEILVKIFQDKSQPILSNENKLKKEKCKKGSISQSTTEDEDESGDDMIYLEPTNVFHNRNNRRVKTSLSTFLDDSDSENEDGGMEKLAAAISDLFTGDWNESEGSDCEQSSEGDEDSDENIKSKSESAHNEPSLNYKKATYILVDAKDNLNLTITPSFLKVFNDIFTIYSNKTLSIINSKKSINLVNDIGPHSKVELFENRSGDDGDVSSILMLSKTYEKEDSCPNSPSKSGYYTNEFIDDGTDDKDSLADESQKLDSEMGYDFETINSLEFPSSTTAELYEKINKQHLKIYVPGFQTLQTSCPKKATEKLMRMHATNSNQIYYVIAKSSINKQARNLVLSSPLQIRNETCFALSILYQPSVLQQLNLEPVGDVTNPFDTTMRIAVLEPHEQYNVPLYIAYHCKLFIQPAYAEGHYASDTGIWWRDLVTDLDTAHNFHCNPKSSSNLEVFSLRVMLKRNINLKKSHGAHSIPNYIIHLLPPLILHNFLPYTLTVENIELKQLMKVEPGEKSSVYTLNLSTDQKLLMKIGYLNSTWVGTLTLTPHLDEKVIVLCSDTKIDGSWTKQLAINVKAERDDSCNVFFYTPYWIVNKTGLPLHLKASSTNTTYGSNNEDIVLFTYKRHGKQTLNLKVYESDWSNEFGLDCAGTTGLVVCKDNERKKRYSFLLSIRLSQMCPRLTKVVTLMPSFMVANNTTRKLRFMEHNDKTDLWVDIQPDQCLPFWPETSSMQMYVKHRESKVASQPFFIGIHHHTVLRMDKGGAICVNVTGGKTEPFKVTFAEYKEGDAPIFVKNMCADLFLKIQQQGQSPVTLLSPYNGLIYTWDDPIKPRQLIWNVYNNKGPGFYIDILKDSYGEEKISFHSVTPGNTNTIVASNSSSEDSDSSDSAKTTLNKKVRRDKIIIYWLCYRDGIQKTLLFTQNQTVYNNIMQTIFMESCDIECLLSFSGIGISWFTSLSAKKEHLFVSLSDAPATWEVNVGHKWKTLTLELASWIEDKYRLHYKKCQLKDYIHIDFEKMFMLKPFFAELRRSYNPAIYLQFRKSQNYKYFNFKVQSLQIDNKQVGSNESVVLCPLPVETIKISAPFLEFSCMKNSLMSCDIYKHIHMTVSDFYVNIQSNLITHIAQQIADVRNISIETAVLYRNDMSLVHAAINTVPKDTIQRSIIENIYLSQTLIQLNILNKTQPSCTSIGHTITNVLSYFFPYNISPYMPVEGVRHKVTPMEITDVLETFTDGIGEIWEHFSSQFIQQYYAQVLGLQVLVNPYAMQAIPNNDKIPNECEKMSNIILFGCRCLLGHSNMSSVALEQCILDVFANQSIENIQRIRRHGSYHNPSNIPKAITISSKNFNPGVILALDQIIAKSQNAGLQCDGELFFRGTGKALISLVTRHPDDKSDNVQVAIEALRRASILGEPIKIHSRLTRYCNNYLGLKPFSIYESMGQYLLETLSNGRFSNDTYWTHATIDKCGKSIIIVSLEHVLKVNKCRLWGPWELEWSLDLDEIISVPKVTTTQLVFNVRQGENEINTDGKININGEKENLIWLQVKIEQAIVVSMEEKSWTLTDN